MRQHLEIREGAYHDSVTLMAVSQRVAGREGVEAALVAMATELNVGMLERMGFDASAATPNDLVVALAAADDEALGAARAAVDEALAETGAGGGGSAGWGAEAPPRTLRSAARRQAHDLALVSVPGEHAFVESMDALRAGLSVMVFSDNVAVDQEIALKAEGRRRGRLVMGPDCGTAIVGGAGLGFANAVASGPVGIVAASGTGAQQLSCLLDDLGIGVSHLLGVGGRDLSADVEAASTLQALAALDADEGTDAIVVLSKPPDPAVAERVRRAAADCVTPVVLGFVGRGERDLTEIAAVTAQELGRDAAEPRSWETEQPSGERLIGLFSGGTLCDEAMAIAADRLGPIRSNVPLEADWALAPERLHSPGGTEHWMIDFGEDEFTRGRPHPMIDNVLRVERLLAEAQAPTRTVALLDVVLGHGAHPDPAGELAPAISEARSRASSAGSALAVVVSLTGSRGDPQGRDKQASALADAGASVHLSNAAAARAAVGLIGGQP